MSEKIRKLAQKNNIVRAFLIAFIAIRVFLRLVTKYCSFFNEDGSVNERAKELAGKSRVARYFLMFLITIRVFCNQIKKHYVNRNEQTSELGGSWLCKWKIAFGVCVAMVTVICCDSIIDTYAAIGRRQDEEIVDVEKEADLESKMKPVQEVSFHYTRGIDKRLYEESEDSENIEESQPVNEAVSESDNLKMTVKSLGFDGDLYEGADEVLYPVVIKNDGEEELTGVRIKTDLMQLSGYDDRLADIILRDSDEEEYAESEVEESETEELETEESNMPEYATEESKYEEYESEESESDTQETIPQLNEPESEEIISEDNEKASEIIEPDQEQFENETIEPESENLQSESECASSDMELSESVESQVEAESADNIQYVLNKVRVEEITGIETLEDLCFSLRSGEEVTIYLSVPEECVYGTYNDIIEVTTEDLEQACSIEVPIRVYAKEGLPWQTTPDRTQPVISYAADVTEKKIQITDVFEFSILENEEYDSGIEQVECYLNGELQELQPEIVDMAQRDDAEVATNIKYQMQFKEEGINNLLIKAMDSEGNESVRSLDVQVVKEEDYHVVMPQRIELTVDPAMAYGDTQIYNLRDFAIENDSIENLLVSISEVNVTVKNGQEKRCSLNMAVIIDGEEVQNTSVSDINTDNTCDFTITGKGVEGEEVHKAYLVFTGMLESENDDWHEGDLDVKIQMKLMEVK